MFAGLVLMENLSKSQNAMLRLIVGHLYHIDKPIQAQ